MKWTREQRLNVMQKAQEVRDKQQLEQCSFQPKLVATIPEHITSKYRDPVEARYVALRWTPCVSHQQDQVHR